MRAVDSAVARRKTEKRQRRVLLSKRTNCAAAVIIRIEITKYNGDFVIFDISVCARNNGFVIEIAEAAAKLGGPVRIRIEYQDFAV